MKTWENILRNRWFWIILVIVLLYIGRAISSKEKNIQMIFGSAMLFAAGIIFLLKLNETYSWDISIVLSIFIWIAFILFLGFIKKIERKWLIRILVILLLLAIISTIGCSKMLGL